MAPNTATRLTPVTALALLSATAARAAFLIDGPPALVQCEGAVYNWTGGAAPWNLNFASDGVREERQLMRSTITNWTVNYPAGSAVDVRIDSASAGSPNFAYAGTQIVQPNPTGDNSCIPPANAAVTTPTDPMQFTTLPETPLRGCETYTWDWTGGQAPYTVNIYAMNSAGLVVQETAQTPSLSWQVNYPPGSTFYLSVQATNWMTGSNQMFSKNYYIFDGFRRDCVPAAHVNASFSDGPPAIPLRPVSVEEIDPSSTALFTGNRDTVSTSLPSGAIVGIVIGAIALLATFAAYAFLRRRQKRREQRDRMYGSGSGAGAFGGLGSSPNLGQEKEDDDDLAGGGGGVGKGKGPGLAAGGGGGAGGGQTSIQMGAMPSLTTAAPRHGHGTGAGTTGYGPGVRGMPASPLSR